MKTALVCIAKNENLYIDEWIKYYFKLGFNDIFVYANDWDFNYNHPNVHITKFNGQGAQVMAYNDCYNKIKDKYNWIAFFDVDEFLVLKKHSGIQDFLKDYTEYPSIGVNWVLFGDNGIKNSNGEFSVLKRFTKRQSSVNIHVKTIYNTSFSHRIGVHNSNFNSISPNLQEFGGPFNYEGKDDIAYLNHYFCKTREEYQNKIDRGRADSPNVIRNYSEFDVHNINEIDDFSARDFMYG